MTGMLRAIFATAPLAIPVPRRTVPGAMSQARRTSVTNRWIADRHTASDAGARRLPGPDGFRTRPPQQGCGLEVLVTTQAPGVSVQPVLHHSHFTPRNTWWSIARSALVHSHAALPMCAASNFAPRASTAHAVRAFLFASATTATFHPRRSRTPSAQRLRRSVRPPCGGQRRPRSVASEARVM